MILVNTVIAGAPRCGTTSLFYWLNAHPEVQGSSKKEAQYLMDKDSSVFRPALNYHDHGLEGYNKHFEISKTKMYKIYLEATPGYMYQQTALKVLSKQLKHVKLIFILREPAERLYSIYSYFSQNRAELSNRISFAEFLEMIRAGNRSLRHNEFLRDAIKHGKYIDYLRQWAAQCGAHRIYLFLYEDLKRDPSNLMKDIAQILNIDTSFYNNCQFQVYNEAYQVKHQQLHKFAASIRTFIPQSMLRDYVRSVYRSINVKKSDSEVQDEDIKDLMADMRAYYTPFNQALQHEFGLKTDAWNYV